MLWCNGLGRPPLKPGERASNYTPFKADDEVLRNLIELARREGVSMSEILNRAFKDYWKKHGAGNYQTMIGSFAQGGIKSDGQLEAEIINAIITKFDHEVRYVEVLKLCRESGFRKAAVSTADRLAYELSKRGWKVWR